MYIKRYNLSLFRLDKVFKKLYEIVKDCKSHYSPKTLIYYRFCILTLWLYIKEGFRPDEVFTLGLIHCTRIITLINSSGRFQILHGQLNLATEKNTASQEGNLKINLSLNDGRLEHGVLLNRNKGGFKRITKHPETGKNFKGFKLPYWEEILLLAEKAAIKFLPLRTIGWDFAITKKDVKILEANAWYGPPNYFLSMDKFIKILCR